MPDRQRELTLKLRVTSDDLNTASPSRLKVEQLPQLFNKCTKGQGFISFSENHFLKNSISAFISNLRKVSLCRENVGPRISYSIVTKTNILRNDAKGDFFPVKLYNVSLT